MRNILSRVGLLALALAVGLLSSGCPEDPAPDPGDVGPPMCPTDGEVRCSDNGWGPCVDPRIDRDHCGGCGIACDPGEICSAGYCLLSCQPGLDECSGTCRDLQTDLEHCGECGLACDSGETCIGGSCTLTCQDGLTNCGGVCRDLQTDSAHCGECDEACAAGQRCDAGDCVLTCQDGLSNCDGVCVDLQTDRTRCGDCTNECGEGEKCGAGECVLTCQSGLTDCGGTCRDLMADPEHCGDCNGFCDPGELCSEGECVLSCQKGLVNCDGTCVDPTTDLQWCGAAADCADTSAGETCAEGHVCAAGQCVLSCQDGQLDCDGTCIDPLSDPVYCGATGNCKGIDVGETCADGHVCAAGMCVLSCQEGLLGCSGTCIDPLTDPTNCGASGGCVGPDAGATCAAGHVCLAGTCTLSCQTGLVGCDGVCVDPKTDHAHCGATGDCTGDSAGSACGDGELCSAGKCALSCQQGLVDCDGTCLDPSVSNQHCGAAFDCVGNNAGVACLAGMVCSGGKCGLTCQDGLVDCGGTCVDPLSDRVFCGATDDCAGENIGEACDDGEVCSAGGCMVSCQEGLLNCAGTCVNPKSSLSWCGASGACAGDTSGEACLPGFVCSDGDCALSCQDGLLGCAGTCADPWTSLAFCGASDGCTGDDAGAACLSGQQCIGGVCELSCTDGLVECADACIDPQVNESWCGAANDCAGDDAGDVCAAGYLCLGGECTLSCQDAQIGCGGSCVDPMTDELWCGAIGKCEGDDAGTPCAPHQTCVAGECHAACPAGFIDCDDECFDPTVDMQHCGECGNACAVSEECVAGQCEQCDPQTTDCDDDGWLAADGDCCDLNGDCGDADPALVNPGAIEIADNGVDDNCNTLTDLFDLPDTQPCDTGLGSASGDPGEFAQAFGICRQTTDGATGSDKTWGLLDAALVRADGTAVGDARAHSLRSGFGSVAPPVTQGQTMVVLSTGIAADGEQTNPGPNGGAPVGGAVSTNHEPTSSVSLVTCTDPRCTGDWLATANPPLKTAGALPVAPACAGTGEAGGPNLARDSIMLWLRLRAPTNMRAFRFNAYALTAEYPALVCGPFKDQLVALVDTGAPPAAANPPDKNLFVATLADGSRWPVSVDLAADSDLFAVCEPEAANPTCWSDQVGADSCAAGASHLPGTGFEANGGCPLGGGTYWLTAQGNVAPGEELVLRVAVWDVGDANLDTTVLLDGFEWLPDPVDAGTH